MSYLGHKGLHGLADRYFSGCPSSAARHLALNAVAKYDPAPWNGAFRYQFIKPYQAQEAHMTTNFIDIKFFEPAHRYTLNGRELTSVTKRLKDIQKPFDRDGIAARVADREGRPVADVLAEWDAKGEAGRTLGIAVHKYIQLALTSQQVVGDPFLALNQKPAQCMVWDVCWSFLSRKLTAKEVEWVIGDAEMGLAGTVDALGYSDETGQYHIIDWKTGKFNFRNPWENLLPPFDDIEASQLNVYSLQQSLYRLILERNTNLDLGDSYLVHLTEKDYTFNLAIDFRARLAEWLRI
jgi:hypothetical protein